MILNILSTDAFYFDRLGKAFDKAFPGEIEFHLCRDSGNVRCGFPVIADKTLPGEIPECGIAYSAIMTDDCPAESDGIRTINKYSSVNTLYHSLRSLYCTEAEEKISAGGCRTLLFTSAAGGTGVSTVAAAAALAGGPGTFFLSLEPVNGTEFFTSGDGPGLGEALFAALSTHGATADRILSAAAEDPCGVSFFRNPRDGRDREGISAVSVQKLISSVQNSGRFTMLCIDLPFGYGDLFRTAADMSDAIVCVSEGLGFPSAKNQAVTDYCGLSGKRLYEIINRVTSRPEDSRGKIFIDNSENSGPCALIRLIAPQLRTEGRLFGKEASDGNRAGN